MMLGIKHVEHVLLCCTCGQVLEMKASFERQTDLHDQFFKQLESAPDGFSVVSEYYGRGILHSADR